MRIRSIKPEFWRSEDITALPRDIRLLFVGLWSYVDDNGVGVNDYRHIAADLFALEEDQNEVREFVQDGLRRLSGASLVTLYTVSGKQYLFINTWDKHQRVPKPNIPRHPRPDDPRAVLTSEYGDSPEDVRTHSGDSPETPVSGTGEQGNRGDKEAKTSSSCPEPAAPDDARSDVDELCARLRDRVIANGAKATITKQWRTEARHLLDRDKRDHAQALRLIDWATSNDFWRTNILSMPKFRAKYDQLLLQAKRETQPRAAPGGYVSQTDANIAAFMAQGGMTTTPREAITGRPA